MIVGKRMPTYLLSMKVVRNGSMKNVCCWIIWEGINLIKQVKIWNTFKHSKINIQKSLMLYRIFASTSQRHDDGLRVSYNISLLIKKSGNQDTTTENLIYQQLKMNWVNILYLFASNPSLYIAVSVNFIWK